MLGAPHPTQVPAGAEVAHAPLGVGLEAATGEHHRSCLDFFVAVGAANLEPGDTAIVILQEAPGASLVADRYAELVTACQ